VSRVTSDRIKEELSWLRVLFPLAIAIEAGLVAYLVDPATPRSMVVVGAVGLGLVGILAINIVVTVNRLLQTLEETPHDIP
jgi:hypothetical protein